MVCAGCAPVWWGVAPPPPMYFYRPPPGRPPLTRLRPPHKEAKGLSKHRPSNRSPRRVRRPAMPAPIARSTSAANAGDYASAAAFITCSRAGIDPGLIDTEPSVLSGRRLSASGALFFENGAVSRPFC